MYHSTFWKEKMNFDFKRNLYTTLEKHNTSNKCRICKTQLGFYTTYWASMYENTKRRIMPNLSHRMKLLNNVWHTQNSAPHLTALNYSNKFNSLFIQPDGTIASPRTYNGNEFNAFECSSLGTKLFEYWEVLKNESRSIKLREKTSIAMEILSHFQEHKSTKVFLEEEYYDKTRNVLLDLVELLPLAYTSLHTGCPNSSDIELIRGGHDSPHMLLLESALIKAPLIIKAFEYIAKLFTPKVTDYVIAEKSFEVVRAAAIVLTALIFLYRRGWVAKNYSHVFMLDMATDYTPDKILDAIILPWKDHHFLGTKLFADKMHAISQLLNVSSWLKWGSFRITPQSTSKLGLSIMLPVILRNDAFSTKVRLSLAVSDHAARCFNANCCTIRYEQQVSRFHPALYIEETNDQTFFKSGIIEGEDISDLRLALNHSYSANRLEWMLMRDFHMIRQNLFLMYEEFIAKGNVTRNTRSLLLSALNEIKEQLASVLQNYPTTNILERTHTEILHQSSDIIGATKVQPKAPLMFRDFILHFRYLLSTIQLSEWVLTDTKPEETLNSPTFKEMKYDWDFKKGWKHLNTFVAPKAGAKRSILEVITTLRNINNYCNFLNGYGDYSYLVTIYPIDVVKHVGVVDFHSHSKSLLLGLPKSIQSQQQVWHSYAKMLIDKLVERDVVSRGPLFEIMNIFGRGFWAIQPGQKTHLLPLTPIKEKNLLSSLQKSMHQFGQTNAEIECFSKHEHHDTKGLCFKEW